VSSELLRGAADRKRTNLNATLQVQPADNLRLTLDGMYDEFKVFSQSNTLGFFVTPSIITAAEFDQNRTATGSHRRSMPQSTTSAPSATVRQRPTPWDSTSIGL
jgi:hypothetical protein